MSTDEFLKQEYMTLRDEIRSAKSRMFLLLILGLVLMPVAGWLAREHPNAFASAAIPFVLLIIMISFIMEQNSIVRAGRYLREHVEPKVKEVVGWEQWLESNPRLREVDRVFVGTFLIIFCLFYAIGIHTALSTISEVYYDHVWYAAVGYGVGGLWLVIVLVRHWRSCMTTQSN